MNGANGSERHPRVGPFLTKRGSGEYDGYTWDFHADVKHGEVYDYIYVHDARGRTGGMGGGGIGGPEGGVLAEPNRNLFATTGSSDSAQGLAKPGERLPPNAVYGAIASANTRVIVHLSDGTTPEATMLPSGEEQLTYFVHVFASGLKVERLIALDPSGNELDRT